MIKRLIGAAAAVLLLAAGPTAAQSRGQRLGGEPSSARDIRILHEFARCVAHRQATRARAVLAMDYRDQAYGHELIRLVDSQLSCAPPGVLRFSRLPFAGGLAEALLHDRLGQGDLATLVGYDPARPPLQARDQGETMSLCAVRADPARVAALLATDPGSQAEAAALNGVTPQVGNCLAAGASMRLNRLGLRAMLALAAYRLSDDNANVAGAAANAPR
jgi:hypothetical protein